MKLRLASLIAALLVPFTASADYILDGGDVIEISVIGKSDLTRRTAVDVDGNIVIPFIGEVRAAGISLTKLREKITDLLSTSNSIRSTDVAVQLVEPRPFYIQGDVMRSGAYPYRPGATVRQALAIAGGLSVIQTGNINPMTVAELRGRYQALRSELAKHQVRVAGLRAEMQSKTEIDLAGNDRGSPSPEEAATTSLQKSMAELAEIEISRLKSRNAAKQKEKNHLSTSLKMADGQVAALEQGQKQDEEAVAQQVGELERVADLARRGLASSGRVTDEQRAAVLLKSREMDTRSRLAAARFARVEALRRLETEDERTVRLPQDLQDAIAEVERTQAQIESVGEQLVMAGESLGELEGQERLRALSVAIYRKQNGSIMRIEADEDTEIAPSDVIEITARFRGMRAATVN